MWHSLVLKWQFWIVVPLQPCFARRLFYSRLPCSVRQQWFVANLVLTETITATTTSTLYSHSLLIHLITVSSSRSHSVHYFHAIPLQPFWVQTPLSDIIVILKQYFIPSCKKSSKTIQLNVFSININHFCSHQMHFFSYKTIEKNTMINHMQYTADLCDLWLR